MEKIRILLSVIVGLLLMTACSSSKAVISNGVVLSNYKYVVFGSETTGDRTLDDIMMSVQNEISNTQLTVLSKNNISEDMYVLTPHINVQSENWDGGHTYITITFYDYHTNQAVAVIKSSGIGMTLSHDQSIALGAIKKKLQNTFGKK